MRIEFSLNDGGTWSIIDDSAVNDGSKKWDMSNSSYNVCNDTSSARIKITCIEYPDVYAISEKFKIDHKKGYPDC